MAREPEPHPDTDQTGATIEFEPVPPPEYVWIDIPKESEVVLAGIHDFPVEIRVGQTTETSPLFLDHGWNYKELCEAAEVDSGGAYVLVQPDVMAADPEQGWIIIPSGEKVSVGRAETPQFRLGNDVARRGHMEIESKEAPAANPETRISALASNPVKVRVKSDFACADYRFLR
jgi:hypothetical protein